MVPLTHSAIAVVVAALLAAVCWGVGDFSGGYATRRAGALQIIALAHGADVLALLLWITLAHAPPPGEHSLLWGLASGLINGFALTAFYVALSTGQMGPAASLGGILTAAIPVVADIFLEGAPSPLHLAGFALAGIAIWLLTRSAGGPAQPASRRANLLACAAGIGFGIFLILSRQASRHALLWPLMASRAGSMGIALAGLALVRGHHAPSLRWRTLTAQAFSLAMVAGVMDMAGNLLFMFSAQTGRLDAASVAASLYPAVTILLAMLLLRERFSTSQAAGMALAALAVALIAAP